MTSRCNLVLLAYLFVLLWHGGAQEPHRRLLRAGRGGGGGGLAMHVTQGWKDLDGVFKEYKSFLQEEQSPYIMYWRPQKVGSSTILSLLTSYAFRYNILARLRSSQNYMCRKIAKCAMEHLDNDHKNASEYTQYASFLERYISTSGRGSLQKKTNYELERIAELIGPYKISTNHELCNLDADLLLEQLPCAFSGVAVSRERNVGNALGATTILDPKTSMTKQSEHKWRNSKMFAGALKSVPHDAVFKELFVVRSPLSRAVSVYYFWGELFKLSHVVRHGRGKDRDQNRRRLEILHRLGQDKVDVGFVKGPLFTYHGNESTVPPKNIAMAFANRLPYIAGMPGPSYTWSAFANSQKAAEDIIRSDRIMTIVTERLDESLVVARHYLNWSMADIVVTKVRKALSAHPKHSEWPLEAVQRMTTKLEDSGEASIYRVSNEKLDERIAHLGQRGVNVTKEVQQLRDVRARVTTVCLSDTYLARYKSFIEKFGLPQHSSENKLRDAEDIYTEQGHAFGYNRDILYSFDVCGNCEAHSIMYDTATRGVPVNDALLLKDLRSSLGKGQLTHLPQFKKCPT